MDKKYEYPEIERRQDILTLAIRQCSEGVAMVDLEGDLVYVNEAFAEMHGYASEDILGKNLSIFHTSEQMSSVDAANRQIKEKGYFKGEVWHKRADGSVFPTIMNNSLIKNDNGESVGMIGTMRDITEQRRAEDALIKSEEKYRFLADNVSDMIWTMDMNFNYTYVSPSITRMLGFTVEEGLARTVEESVTPASFNNTMKVLAEELELHTKGQASFDRSIKIENELFCKDGSTIWTEAEVAFIYDSKGQPNGVVGATRDITKRKKAEQSLKYFECAVEASSDAIGMSTVEGKHWYQNKSFNDLFGDIGTDPPASLYVDENVGRKVFQSIMAGNPWSGQVEMYGRGRKVLYIMLRAYSLKDEHGRILALVGVHTDITDHKMAEEALKESELKHKTLVNNIPGMVYRAYPDWSAEVVSGSKAVCGYTEEELNSHVNKWVNIVHPDDKKRVLENGSELVKEQKSIVQTYRIINKSGNIRWVEDRKASVSSEGGEFLGIDGVVFDITDRKQLEQELLEAKIALEEKVEERTAELNEKNITLKVLLDQRGTEKKKLEELIMSNVKKLLMPNINRLQRGTLSSKQQTALNVLKANLNEIIFPFSKTIDSKYMKLTPTEIEVANHIKHGASSKDIAESLALSQRTVDTHRYNIRKKLGISRRGVNLRTYLSSI